MESLEQFLTDAGFLFFVVGGGIMALFCALQ